MDYNLDADPVIQALIIEATADPDVLGLVLTGSRAIGATGPDSDYDVVFVVSDEALACYELALSHPTVSRWCRRAMSRGGNPMASMRPSMRRK